MERGDAGDRPVRSRVAGGRARGSGVAREAVAGKWQSHRSGGVAGRDSVLSQLPVRIGLRGRPDRNVTLIEDVGAGCPCDWGRRRRAGRRAGGLLPRGGVPRPVLGLGEAVLSPGARRGGLRGLSGGGVARGPRGTRVGRCHVRRTARPGGGRFRRRDHGRGPDLDLDQRGGSERAFGGRGTGRAGNDRTARPWPWSSGIGQASGGERLVDGGSPVRTRSSTGTG